MAVNANKVTDPVMLAGITSTTGWVVQICFCF